MMNVIRDGDSIGAPESATTKDDRVIALALCNRAWIDSLMMPLLSQGDTYDAYIKSENGEPIDKSVKFINNIVGDFFKTAEEMAENPQMSPQEQWLRDKGFLWKIRKILLFKKKGERGSEKVVCYLKAAAEKREMSKQQEGLFGSVAYVMMRSPLLLPFHQTYIVFFFLRTKDFSFSPPN